MQANQRSVMNYRASCIATFATFIAAAAAAIAAPAPPKIPTVVNLQHIKWHSTAFARVYVASITIAKNSRGAQVILVRLDSGARVPPHTHPSAHLTTVLSGTFYLGSGTRFDASNMMALTPGTAIIIPADAPHYVWAKDGQVIVEQVGFGPAGISVVHRSVAKDSSPPRPSGAVRTSEPRFH